MKQKKTDPALGAPSRGARTGSHAPARQFVQSTPSLLVFRVELQGGPEMVEGFGSGPFFVEQNSHIVVKGCLAGLDLQGLPKFLNRFVESPLARQSDPQIVVRIRKVGLQ